MEKEIITLQEECTLPSQGLIYGKKFDPVVTLRSMTTAEEMRRLQHSDTPYKIMSDIIEDCMVSKLPIHIYDLCLGDYNYLLHHLRIATYGDDYKLDFICPKCGEIVNWNCSLSGLKVKKADEETLKDAIITLPVTKNKIKLRMQTPRDLDYIATKAKEQKHEFPDMLDPTVLLSIETMIAEVNGEIKAPDLLDNFISKLPMKDTNYLVQKATKLNGKVGVDTSIKAKCKSCGESINTVFRFTSEFFGPTVD